MNTNYNTSIKGEYTFYDENMNVLSQTDNLITDWGMRRFVGDRSEGAPHPVNTDNSQLAFINNTKFILLGTGTTLVSATDFKLNNSIPLSSYNEFPVESSTGTLLSVHDPSGDLLMIFTRTTKFVMASSFNISPNEYHINEVGCNWTKTIQQENNRYGIFSRANLSNPFTLRPNNTVIAKYTLTIKSDCNQIKQSMPRFNGTGAINLPFNKTNIRNLPLYTLKSDGSPSSVLNNGSGGERGAINEFISPLFEDIGSNNDKYVGGGFSTGMLDTGIRPMQDTTLGTSTGNFTGYKLWWLQMYTSDWNITGSLSAINGGANFSRRYDTFTSSTTSNMNNITNIVVNSYRGSSTYNGVISENLNVLLDANNPLNISTGRKPADSSELIKINDNTWNHRIRFLFFPGEVKNKTTVFKLYKATLGDWDGSGYSGNWGTGYIYLDSTASHNYGVVTALSAEYTANPSLYEGFEYNFTFTRD